LTRSHPTNEPMSATDQLLLFGEPDPEKRRTLTAVYLLDAMPSWSAVQSAFERTSRELSRMRQRIVNPTQGLGPPRWMTDPDFDLAYHLRHAQLPDRASLRTLLDAIEPELMTALDPSRPLWEATLYEGLDSKGAALVIKTSLALSDVLGGRELERRLFDSERDADAKSMPPVPPPEDSTPDELAAKMVRRLPQVAVSSAISLASRAAKLGRRIVEDPRGVTDSVADGIAYANSLGRVIDAGAAPSPLLARRSRSRRVFSIDLPLSQLEAAADIAGGSLEEVFLAGVCGALARYHEKMSAPTETVPLSFSMSLSTLSNKSGSTRTSGSSKKSDQEDGPSFVGVKIAAPIGACDPTDRVHRIRDRLRARRTERAFDYKEWTNPLMAALPREWATRIGRAIPAADVQASVVTGCREDLFLAGARVDRILAIGPLADSALMAVLTTHADLASITLNFDPASVQEAGSLEACLRDAFEEILSLGPTNENGAPDEAAEESQ
jgi:diacylglycerol O-acyltransferase / wax synthase